MEDWGFNTKALHAGNMQKYSHGATTVPIFGTASYEFDSAEEIEGAFAGTNPGYTYSRISNPTVTAFEQRIAALEGGIGAVGCASGMAALNTVFAALLKSGDEIAAGSGLFGGTLSYFRENLTRFNVKTSFFDPTDAACLKSVISDKTKVVFLESLGNPSLSVPDFEGIQKICGERNLPLIVDNTLPSPALFQPRAVGAAIVVHSVTKFLTGNGSAIGGVFVDTGEYDWSKYPDSDVRNSYDKFGSAHALLAFVRKTILTNSGGCMSPFNAYLHLIGVESLGLRMERHCSNALELAEMLSDSPSVSDVNYPGLPASPWYPRANAFFQGKGGGLVTVRLSSKESSRIFLNRLKIAKNVANLGDAKTLVIHPASTIYRNCTPAEKGESGVTDELIRISVGIEDFVDLKRDFLEALKGVE